MAYVSPAWPQGVSANGVVTYTTHLVEALRGMGHRPYVLALRRESDSPEPFVLDAWAERGSRPLGRRLVDFLGHRLAPRRWWPVSLAASLRSRVGFLAREAGVQIVEIEEAFGVARHLAERSEVPVVVRLHGPWFLVAPSLGLGRDAASRQRIRAEGRALRAAAAVTAPSEDVIRRAREAYGLALPHAKVIPNPIAPVAEAKRWSAAQCDPESILFVGRFDRCKGADTMVGAFGRVGAIHPSSRLTLVGPDRGLVDEGGWTWSAEAYLADRLGDASVRSRVVWLGAQPPSRIVELRRRCFVTVVCSRYENFPMTALEAMAFGSPLIASRVGGLPEMIQDGRNGLLCLPDDPRDLAEKILTLLGDPALAARLGRQACIDAEERYHPRAITERMLDFYRGVIERASGADRRGLGVGLRQ
ncbi:MAG: glycosyltransferase family 4 protein [Planctomycetota bacterium]